MQLPSDGEAVPLAPLVFDIPAARFTVSWGSLLHEQDVVIVTSDESAAALPDAGQSVDLPEYAFAF